ncbi:MAG: hypothetical protein Q9187_004233, partial [Circinaria calcarea]
MGWFWGEPAATDGAPSCIKDESSIRPEITNSRGPQPSSKPIPEQPRVLSRDEQADAELQEFLKELHTEQEDASPAQAAPSTSQINHSSIAPSVLYPTTMSCRAAFDSAFYCQSLGGQFTSIYRYGKIRNCSDQWHNFWFCMRTNRGMMGEEERKRRIQDHYRARDT